MGPDGMDSSDLTKIAGKAVVGMYYTSAAGPASALPKAKAFVDEYKKKFSKNPEPYAAEAYDADHHRASRPSRPPPRAGKVPSREDVVTAPSARPSYAGITGEHRVRRQGRPPEGASTSSCRSRATIRRSGATTRSSSS